VRRRCRREPSRQCCACISLHRERAQLPAQEQQRKSIGGRWLLRLNLSIHLDIDARQPGSFPLH